MLVIYSNLNNFDVSETVLAAALLIKGTKDLEPSFSSVLWDTLSPCQPTDSWLGRILVCFQEPPTTTAAPPGCFYWAPVISQQTSQLRLVCSVTDEPLAVQSSIVIIVFVFQKCLLLLYPFHQRFFSWRHFLESIGVFQLHFLSAVVLMGTTCLVGVWVWKQCQTLLQLPSRKLRLLLNKLMETTAARPINLPASAAISPEREDRNNFVKLNVSCKNKAETQAFFGEPSSRGSIDVWESLMCYQVFQGCV